MKITHRRPGILNFLVPALRVDANTIFLRETRNIQTFSDEETFFVCKQSSVTNEMLIYFTILSGTELLNLIYSESNLTDSHVDKARSCPQIENVVILSRYFYLKLV